MKIKGFTLIELIVFLAVVTLLVVFSAESSTQMLAHNEKQSLIDDIRTLVQYARIQAVAQGHKVSLSPLSSDLDWSKGVILSQFNQLLNQEEVLHSRQWHYRYWSVRWSGASSEHKIVFANNTNTAINNGTFILTNRRTNDKIALVLNRLGRVKVEYNRFL